jgi:hypothetical protein
MATETKVIEIKVINIKDYVAQIAVLTKAVDYLKEANKKLDKTTDDYNLKLAQNNIEIKKAQAEIKTLTNEIVNEIKIREKRSAQIEKAAAKEIADQQAFLENALGNTSIAQERLKQAQLEYTKASISTEVSQEQLEALRQKAIQAAEAVVQALRLQNNAEVASA